ncbi:MAG TPA: response regulator [Paraburkholderia sp.]|jgi:CheY-like chemotaxis protein
MTVILLVDDDNGLLSSLGLLIAAEGYVVRTATNGLDALLLARASRPDVLISDTAMPVMDGPALIRAMRKDPMLSSVPVILTYNGALPPRVRVFRFMRKPLRYAKVLKILRRVERHHAKISVSGRHWRIPRRSLRGEPKIG